MKKKIRTEINQEAFNKKGNKKSEFVDDVIAVILNRLIKLKNSGKGREILPVAATGREYYRPYRCRCDTVCL